MPAKDVVFVPAADVEASVGSRAGSRASLPVVDPRKPWFALPLSSKTTCIAGVSLNPHASTVLDSTGGRAAGLRPAWSAIEVADSAALWSATCPIIPPNALNSPSNPTSRGDALTAGVIVQATLARNTPSTYVCRRAPS